MTPGLILRVLFGVFLFFVASFSVSG